MSERELENLKHLPTPPRRDSAKAAALKAALDAFDRAQGNRAKPRPISTSHRTVRRNPMVFTRTQYAIAASVAALMIAAPFAFQSNRSGPPLSKTMQEPAADSQPKDPLANGNKVEIARVEPKPDSDDRARQGQARVVAGKDEAEPKPSQAPANVPHEAAPTVVPGLLTSPGTISPASPTDGLNAVGGARPDLKAKSLLQERAAGIAEGSHIEKRGFADKPILGLGYEPNAEKQEADRTLTYAEQEYRDAFEATKSNPVKQVAAEPVSTFSIDVDTASYSFVRRALNAGQLPPKDSVRVEEMINYFPYDYPLPERVETPFRPTVTVMPSPWNVSNRLVHVAIKGYELKTAERPRANLVFLMDVSGSMAPPDRLPLVKNAFRLLVDELSPDDTVAIVTYASGSGIHLEPTKIADKPKILAAIDRLSAGGSTAGAQGIQDAYRLAEANFDKSAVNRVILATDGDFNVGITDPDDLKGMIERKRENGVFLSILGVGQGNYNDALMQALAQNGNGTAAYVDTLHEARKVLVEEASSTLFTIAKDVKIQIEWNPARVSAYRLIGYETRALAREDFNNDRVDAGDIGSGHTVTAIYEITPANSEEKLVDALRYAKPEAASSQLAGMDGQAKEIGYFKMRYKLPKEDASKLIELPITDAPGNVTAETAPEEARFSVAVAAFGQLLKGSPYLKGYGYDDVMALAQSARGPDPYGYRAEFLKLVRLAKSARP
jgi:Ca-activated chloride channel family protein